MLGNEERRIRVAVAEGQLPLMTPGVWGVSRLLCTDAGLGARGRHVNAEARWVPEAKGAQEALGAPRVQEIRGVLEVVGFGSLSGST